MESTANCSLGGLMDECQSRRWHWLNKAPHGMGSYSFVKIPSFLSLNFAFVVTGVCPWASWCLCTAESLTRVSPWSNSVKKMIKTSWVYLLCLKESQRSWQSQRELEICSSWRHSDKTPWGSPQGISNFTKQTEQTEGAFQAQLLQETPWLNFQPPPVSQPVLLMLSCLLYTPDPISRVFLAHDSVLKAAQGHGALHPDTGKLLSLQRQLWRWLGAHPRLLRLPQFEGALCALTLSKLQEEQPFLKAGKVLFKGFLTGNTTEVDFFSFFYHQCLLWFLSFWFF